jgi:hypothetical protein
MIPDLKWLVDALRLPFKVIAAVALSAIVLLALDLSGLLDLGPLTIFARPVLIMVSVVSGTLVVVEGITYLMAPFNEKQRQSALASRRALRKQEEDGQRQARQAQVIARLDHLSREEIRYVAEALTRDSPTFYTYIHSPPVTMLVGKGLVWTPGGQHHMDHYPFSFYDWVWTRLVERREEFLAKEAEHVRAEEAARAAERRRHRY